MRDKEDTVLRVLSHSRFCALDDSPFDDRMTASVVLVHLILLLAYNWFCVKYSTLLVANSADLTLRWLTQFKMANDL